MKKGNMYKNLKNKKFDNCQKVYSSLDKNNQDLPNDNIDRSIKKASGELSGVNYEACTYEGYGVGGSAVIVECLTDNKNRTAGDVRHAFDKYNGSLGSTGCVSYLFSRKGVIIVPRNEGVDADELMLIALDLGAKDVQEFDDEIEIYIDPNDCQTVREGLEGAGYEVVASNVDLIASNYVDLDANQLVSFNKLVATLEELDDVQNVYHNVNLPEDEEEE